MQGLDEAARRDSEPEAVTQQRRDLLERYADVLVQEHNQGHGTGPEVHIGGPQRVGRLQRMPALDAAATGDAPADVHVEAPDDRPPDGQIFLILRGDAGALDRAATVRAGGGKRGLVSLIDPPWNGSSGPTPVGGARRAVPAVCRSPGAESFANGAGLTEAGAPCRIELLFQARNSDASSGRARDSSAPTPRASARVLLVGA